MSWHCEHITTTLQMLPLCPLMLSFHPFPFQIPQLYVKLWCHICQLCITQEFTYYIYFVGKESTCLGKTNHNSEKLKNKNWYRLKRLHSINCIYDNEDSSLILTRRLHTFEHYQGVDFVIRFREQLIEAIFTMWRSWQMWTTTLINQLTHNLRFHWLYGRNSKFSWVWTYQKRENMLTSR